VFSHVNGFLEPCSLHLYIVKVTGGGFFPLLFETSLSFQYKPLVIFDLKNTSHEIFHIFNNKHTDDMHNRRWDRSRDAYNERERESYNSVTTHHLIGEHIVHWPTWRRELSRRTDDSLLHRPTWRRDTFHQVTMIIVWPNSFLTRWRIPPFMALPAPYIVYIRSHSDATSHNTCKTKNKKSLGTVSCSPPPIALELTGRSSQSQSI
jgi:hypothetical protein